MGRRSEDERAEDEKFDRQRRGGRWLRRERDARRIKQETVAERLGVSQQQYSKYERGVAPIPLEAIPTIAAILEVAEAEVWRCLGKQLPAEYRTDEEAIAYVEARYPGLIDRVLGGNPGPKKQQPVAKRRGVTRKGDPPVSESRPGSNAV
jgi:transcriptional regulator with XRE-family HTH domain